MSVGWEPTGVLSAMTARPAAFVQAVARDHVFVARLQLRACS